jgi:hypothetical protein
MMNVNGDRQMTLMQFRAKAHRLFQRANPGATMTWTHGPVRVRWADGSRGFSGVFRATAAGYRTRTMTATSHAGDCWVR